LKDSDAVKYDTLGYDQFFEKEFGVMDLVAVYQS
jgi:uridylate kinase